MTADMLSTTAGGGPASKTITIRLSTLQSKSSKSAKNQKIIVIPHSMLVNGCISAKKLNNIIQDPKPSIKSMENETNLKRHSNSGYSTYGTDSEEGSSINEGGDSKAVRKRANLDHLSLDEKLMRRKLKNRVAAQNARDMKRVKMENMKGDLDRLKAHAKSLEARNAQLVSENESLVAKNKQLCSNPNTKGGREVNTPLVVQQSESAAGTGLSSLCRWTTDLNSLPGDSLEVVVECNGGQQMPEKVASKEENPMAKVIMGQILKSEDFDHISDEQDSKACEQMLDNILKFSSLNSSMSNQETDSSEASSNDATNLNTAWEEHFGDLFPDLRECTF